MQARALLAAAALLLAMGAAAAGEEFVCTPACPANARCNAQLKCECEEGWTGGLSDFVDDPTKAAAFLKRPDGATSPNWCDLGAGVDVSETGEVSNMLASVGIGLPPADPCPESLGETFRVPSGLGVALNVSDVTFTLLFDDGDFVFTFGFCTAGSVAGVDAVANGRGFALACLQDPAGQLIFDENTGDQPGDERTVTLPLDTDVIFWLLPNNTLAEFVEKSALFYPSQEYLRQPLFSVSAANPDQLDQMLFFAGNGATLLTWEDKQLGRGAEGLSDTDSDFNDMAFSVDVAFRPDQCGTPVCDPPCDSVYGACNTNFTCDCETGWFGDTCNEPRCDPACPANADCVAPDLCECKPGWTGENCTEYECEPECPVNSRCNISRVCECDEGWSGENCTTPECKDPACPANAECVAPETCRCKPGWSGDNCTTPECTDPACPANSTCVAPNTCQCDEGWSGENCTTPECKDPACPANADCVAPETCRCKPGWTGDNCTEYECEPECGTNQFCNVSRACECEPGWSGENCTTPECTDPACPANADCVAPDTCRCHEGWSGENCTTPECKDPACPANADCVAPETCECKPGWTGDNCTEYECEPGCGTNQFCNVSRACECEPLWSGENCTVPECEPECPENAHCTANHTCECDELWSGPNCTVPECDPECPTNAVCTEDHTCVCKSGWAGGDCSVCSGSLSAASNETGRAGCLPAAASSRPSEVALNLGAWLGLEIFAPDGGFGQPVYYYAPEEQSRASSDVADNLGRQNLALNAWVRPAAAQAERWGEGAAFRLSLRFAGRVSAPRVPCLNGTAAPDAGEEFCDGSPHTPMLEAEPDSCYGEDEPAWPGRWTYFLSVASGSLVGAGPLAGANVSLVSGGEAAQVGQGANGANTGLGLWSPFAWRVESWPGSAAGLLPAAGANANATAGNGTGNGTGTDGAADADAEAALPSGLGAVAVDLDDTCQPLIVVPVVPVASTLADDAFCWPWWPLLLPLAALLFMVPLALMRRKSAPPPVAAKKEDPAPAAAGFWADDAAPDDVVVEMAPPTIDEAEPMPAPAAAAAVPPPPVPEPAPLPLSKTNEQLMRDAGAEPTALPNTFKMGKRTIKVKVVRGQLLVRVGGGFVTYNQFTKKYSSSKNEDRKATALAHAQSSMSMGMARRGSKARRDGFNVKEVVPDLNPAAAAGGGAAAAAAAADSDSDSDASGPGEDYTPPPPPPPPKPDGDAVAGLMAAGKKGGEDDAAVAASSSSANLAAGAGKDDDDEDEPPKKSKCPGCCLVM